MAWALWGGEQGSGKMGSGIDEEVLLTEAEAELHHQQWVGGDGHVSRPREGPAGSPVEGRNRKAFDDGSWEMVVGTHGTSPLHQQGGRCQPPGWVADEQQVGQEKDHNKPAKVQRTAPAPLKTRRKVTPRTFAAVTAAPLNKASLMGRRDDTQDEEEEEEEEEEGAAYWPPQCSHSVHAYERLGKIGEGDLGVVFKAVDRETGEMVALKKMDMEYTTVREIRILSSLPHHPCVVHLKELVYGDGPGRDDDGIFLVLEYAEYDLHRVIEEMKRPFTQGEVKFLIQRLLQGIQCLHGEGVLHRDLTPSNLLLTRSGDLKVCDFGMSRRCIGGIADQRPYTCGVVTMWYRAPELLLRAKEYSAAIDLWAAGCIMAELLVGKAPMFQGRNPVDQLHQVFQVLGTPDGSTWPGFAALCAQMNVGFPMQPRSDRLREKLLLPPTSLWEAGFDLLMGLLRYDPSMRLTAEQALNHEWFTESPVPTRLPVAGGDELAT